MTNQTIDGVLDAPVAFQTPDCPDCACIQDGQCLCIPSKPAARTQGDPVDWVPTVAQIRYRRPERDCPDFGPWHDLRIEFYDEKRTNYIDMAGWHCETRLLYLPVTKS